MSFLSSCAVAAFPQVPTVPHIPTEQRIHKQSPNWPFTAGAPSTVPPRCVLWRSPAYPPQHAACSQHARTAPSPPTRRSNSTGTLPAKRNTRVQKRNAKRVDLSERSKSSRRNRNQSSGVRQSIPASNNVNRWRPIWGVSERGHMPCRERRRGASGGSLGSLSGFAEGDEGVTHGLDSVHDLVALLRARGEHHSGQILHILRLHAQSLLQIFGNLKG